MVKYQRELSDIAFWRVFKGLIVSYSNSIVKEAHR